MSKIDVSPTDIGAWIARHLAAREGIDVSAIDATEPFQRLGLDSIGATSMLVELGAWLGRPLSPTLVWEYPTPEALTRYLAGKGTGEVVRAQAAVSQDQDEPIAIVGMACRFPGAPNIEAYWNLLRNGVDAIREVPKDRWNIDEFYAQDPHAPGKMRTRWGGFLERVDEFDPQFFGISPREAIQVDPQQRLMLELTWEALENAGITPDSIKGSDAAVLVGALFNEYMLLQDRLGPEAITTHTSTGGASCIIANRISYAFGLMGASMTVETACSSALVAVHLACSSLRRGETSLALAGGVNLLLVPETTVGFERLGAMSPTGRSKAFDASADGYVRSDGAGLVVLKRLRDAIADGDRIFCVIRGGAINNDGPSNGLTAPNPAAQRALLARACRDGGIDPLSVQYVETHGTGTPLGDPIEASGLGAVYGANRSPGDRLRIGSVKTNIGHLEAAAGIAGVIKAALILERGMIPPSLHFNQPNPLIDFDALRLRVISTLEAWPDDGKPRRAGVSSYGYGGTGAHIVLEGASGYRQALPIATNVSPRGAAWIFSGQGSVWLGMGRDLLLQDAAFRAAIVQCDAVLRREIDLHVLDELYSGSSTARLERIDIAWPLLFAFQVALAALWRSRGLEPSVVLGHSIGEVAAAHIAGALTLEDAARVICQQARLVQQAAGNGAMAFVALRWADVETRIARYEGKVACAIAASPLATVISGDADTVSTFVEQLQKDGVFARLVATKAAVHSHHMDAARQALPSLLDGIRPRKTTIPIVSSVTGARISGNELDPQYWANQLSVPVRFMQGIESILTDGGEFAFLEVSPHPIVQVSIRESLQTRGNVSSDIVVASLVRSEPAKHGIDAAIEKLCAVGVGFQSPLAAPKESRPALLPISAKTHDALVASAKSYQEWLLRLDTPLHHVAYTASLRRSHLEHRLSVVGSTKEEISAALGTFVTEHAAPAVVVGKASSNTTEVIFVFPGQGSQWVGMGRQLYREESVFRNALRACDEEIRKEAGFSIIEELDKPTETSRLGETIVAQPALFAIEVALSALLGSWGIIPSAVVGHSVGEIAAAHIAGIVDLQQAARLVSIRARVMQRATGHGKMVSVSLDEQAAKSAISGLENRVGIAAINDPTSIVLSGDVESIAGVVEKLTERNVQTRYLRVNYAFHSPQMEPLLPEFVENLGELHHHPARIPMFSTLTGKPLQNGELDVTYWAKNIRQTVRFAEAIAAASGKGAPVFIEVGPHPVLAISMEQVFAKTNQERKIVTTLRRDKDERKCVLEASGALFAYGCDLDWKPFFPRLGDVVDLPSYPWQRQTYWIDKASHTRSLQPSAGHPLLGVALSIADTKAAFELELESKTFDWLEDHRVFGAVVVPGAALVEMAHAAGVRHLGTIHCEVSHFVIVAALTLAEDEKRRVQVLLQQNEDALNVRIFSRSSANDNDSWMLHAEGAVRAADESTENIDIASIRARMAEEIPATEVYTAFAHLGLDYGAAFRNITNLWRGNDEAISRVVLPENIINESSAYGLHPVALDAALQTLISTRKESQGQTYLPFELDKVNFFGAVPPEVWVHAQIVSSSTDGDSLAGSITIADNAGRRLASASNVAVKRASARALRQNRAARAQSADMYRLEWREHAISQNSQWPSGSWLLVGDPSSLVAQFEQRLGEAGFRAVRTTVEHIADVLQQEASSAREWAGVICFWDQDASKPPPDTIASRAEAMAVTALDIVRALIRATISTRLNFVTCNAVGVHPGETVSLEQAPLWGFGRVVRNEHPEFTCKLIDVDGSSSKTIASLWAELSTEDDENEVVWRDGKRFVSRLTRAATTVGLRAPANGQYALVTRGKGELSNLSLESIERRGPGIGEIEIEVHATGLNFRDVMNALGMYPGSAITLGIECAGVVVAIGEEVQGFALGDRVMAVASGSFQAFVTVDARRAARVPRHLTMAQAATIPIVFLTAWYALHDLGNLQRGEHILVHAAAGGVGMAAVQIAHRIGAKVFATASTSKWAIVRQMGVEHVANSRTLDFATAFRTATQGHGIDLVLNSLAGEFVDASLSLLSPGGRFLEMGKTDIRSPDVVEKSNPGRHYRAFDLMDVNPTRIHEMLHALVDEFEAGTLSPLPVRGFALAEAEDAFRFMARARHVGKIALCAAPRRSFDQNATVLITGGFGALGLRVAHWLFHEHGVAHIVLVGRHAPTGEKLAELERLQTAGCDVTAAYVDVSNASATRELIESIAADKPIRGIVHAAGVLDDGTIAEQNSARFGRVFAAKVHGAYHLHEATKTLPLDFFIMFSSVASVFGSAGQSNYAAANAFLDALAHARRAQGLPAQSLNWGPWAEGGMALTLSESLQARFARLGMHMLEPAHALALLGEALTRPDAELLFGHIDLNMMGRAWGPRVPPLWRVLQTPKPDEVPRLVKGSWREKLSNVAASGRGAEVTAALRGDVAKVLSLRSANDVPEDRPLRELGLDSLMAVELRNAISARVGKPLPATLLFDYPTVKTIRQYLLEKILVFETPAVVAIAPKKTTAPIEESIAIIGVGCRFPGGVHDLESFWHLLENEIDAIREVPTERWDVTSYYDPNPNAEGKMMTRWGGFLDDVELFEPSFFGIAPREALSLDPQQRILLETTWEALENAGIVPEQIMGSNTGVYVGVIGNEYQYRTMASATDIDAYSYLGTAHSATVGRISYFLGLQGPNIALDTACSSSLVSIHLACQALRSGECTLALAGGVNLVLSPEGMVYFSKLKAMSPTGRCHTFSADADGYVRSEGSAMIVLKRLSAALQDGDRILATIRGTAVNQDGRSQGLTAPNGPAQEAVLRKALTIAGVHPSAVDYVEAHGTGTPLGDPIEVQALANVLGDGRDPQKPLLIGSVKTNIGHTESAAGIAGLLKVVLSLQHGQIPRSLHFTRPNPHIAWSDLPLKVASEAIPWRSKGPRRLAGVSSFGFSGTNAHVILEEAPSTKERESAPPRSVELVVLSGKTDSALDAQAARLRDSLENHPEWTLGDIAYSLATTRSAMEHRLALPTTSRDALLAALESAAQGQIPPGAHRNATNTAPDKLAFLFTGQGAQMLGMGRGLHGAWPVFREAFDRCVALFDQELGESLRDVMWAQDEHAQSAKLDQTAYTQPALFVLEYALFALWRSWGITPDFVAGHSIGEIVAACVAGVFSLEDAVRLVAARGRLMQALPPGGAMVSIATSEADVSAVIAPSLAKVSIAAINGPENVVLAGDAATVHSIAESFVSRGVRPRALRVSHAFHSPLMDPMLDEFRRTAQSLKYNRPSMALWSNVTGKACTDEILSAEYWVRHVREPVRFADGIQTLHEAGATTFVELGPKSTLLGLVPDCLSGAQIATYPSLRNRVDEPAAVLEALGGLWARGIQVNWLSVFPTGGRRLALPTYPWQRQKYWIERPTDVSYGIRHGLHTSGHPLLGEKQTLSTQVGTHLWETPIDLKRLPWLGDHRVKQAVVFPGAGYLEMALSSGFERFGDITFSMTDVEFVEALVFSDEPTQVQTVTTEEETGRMRWQIASRFPNDKQTSYRVHARGTLRQIDSEQPATHLDMAAIRAKMNARNRNDVYAELATMGLEYGPAFQGIIELWHSDHEAVGHVRPPEAANDGLAYRFHPALLDACLQVAVGILGPHREQAPWVPTAVKALHCFSRATDEVYCHAQTSDDESTETRHVNLVITDASGLILARIDGLVLQRLSNTAEHREGDDWFLSTDWEPAPVPALREEIRQWLLVGGGTFGLALRDALKLRGHSAVHVEAHDSNVGAYQSLLTRTFQERAPARIVHLDGLEGRDDADFEALEHAYESVVCLVQAVTKMRYRDAPRLWIITRGVHSVENEKNSVVQAPLIGLGRTIALEHAELRCCRIDLDRAGDAGNVEALVAELLAEDNEDEIAIRHGQRRVARLIKRVPESDARDVIESAAGRPYRLEIDKPGALDDLIPRLTERRAPGRGEVEIAVEAAGLNFLDVLLAMGVMPNDVAENASAPRRFGGECAGRIVAVGESVNGLSVGDSVVALAQGALASHVTTNAELVLPRPTKWSATDAAAMPIVYLTAYYALDRIGHLERGERVLIHAAAGGVGLAAVQWAQHVGAEVYATTSTPEKRALLESLGVRFVSDSRSDRFVKDVLEWTHGEGVDVVLNSLSGEFITKSFRLLRDHGRFIELGKRDYYADNQIGLKPFLRNLSFSLVDLRGMILKQPNRVRTLFQKLLALLEDGTFTAPRVEVVPMANVAAAFQKMARAQHVGKLVIAMNSPDIQIRISAMSKSIRENGSYLVTGGLGGLGLTVAQWLSTRGAGQMVLMGRSGVTNANQKEAIARMESRGTRVVVAQGDVANRADVERVLREIDESGVPLRGVVHAAGLVDDGLLDQQSLTRFRRVMAPKVLGAWHLHALTKARALDFFILYSSIAGVLGSAGQSNYAAANTFLDALAQHRRALGLPATSIDWGAFSDVGLAAAQENRGSRLASRGMRNLTPIDGILVLERILHSNVAQIGVVPLDIRQWGGFHQAAASSPRLSRLRDAQRTESGHKRGDQALLEQLSTATPEARATLLLEAIKTQVSHVLRIPAESMDINAPLTNLGMDSLMSLELRNRIEAALAIKVPGTLLWTYPTVTALVTHFAATMHTERVVEEPVVIQEKQPTETVEVVEPELSDDELLDALRSELD